VRVDLLAEGEEDAWRRFVESSPDSVLGHRIEWRAVFARSLRHEMRYLVARDEGRIVGLLPLAIVDGIVGGRAMVSLPWLDAAGPLSEDPAVCERLVEKAIELARETRCRYVELRSLRRLSGPEPVRTNKVVLLLPLREPEAMWKGFSAKVRNQVRKAERERLSSQVGGAELLGEFYQVFSTNMRDLGVPVWGFDFFETIIESLGTGASVITVRLGERPVGGAILLLHGETAVVPSASSLRAHFAECPNHLLYWTALQTAQQKGARRFDFGRSTPGSGTYRFKKQWGAEERQCYWHYALLGGGEPPDKTTDSRKLRAAVWVWKRLPLAVANRIGPSLVRRIP
jgi:serine/alanine adding enzyme